MMSMLFMCPKVPSALKHNVMRNMIIAILEPVDLVPSMQSRDKGVGVPVQWARMLLVCHSRFKDALEVKSNTGCAIQGAKLPLTRQSRPRPARLKLFWMHWGRIGQH